MVKLKHTVIIVLAMIQVVLIEDCTRHWDKYASGVFARFNSGLNYQVQEGGATRFTIASGGASATFNSTIASGAITSTGAVFATEYESAFTGGMLDWANGDARIVVGLVN